MMNNVTELGDWGRDSVETHVMRTIFVLEAVFEPYDCANLNLTVIPSKTKVRGNGGCDLQRGCDVFLFQRTA